MSSRVSTALSRTTNASVFDSQPQEQPLNQKAFTELENLRRYGLKAQGSTGNQNTGLDACLRKASELLNEVVTEVNDRAWEERIRRQNRQQKSKRDEDLDAEEDSQEKEQRYDAFRQKVEGLNTRLDENMRKVVDDQTWVSGLSDSIKHVMIKSKDVHTRQAQNANINERDQNDVDDEDNEIQQPMDLEPSEYASALLHAAQSTASTEWNSKSLTEKYSQNPAYVDFYKVRFDAQNQQENPPPVPHHSVWFARLEGRNGQRGVGGTQRSTQRSVDDNDEDNQSDSMMQEVGEDTELQVASENISCKCPLTLQWFKEPMTSTKCPHSFERDAILSLIRTSETRIPLSAEQEAELDERHPRGSKGRTQAETYMKARNPKCARCPETGCQQLLTEEDIRFDIALQRRTKRAQEAEQREFQEDDADDDEDSDDALPHTQRRKRNIIALGSSPASRRRTFVKPEREPSVIPNSQSQSQIPQTGRARNGRRRRGFVDIDDDDDDDEDMQG